MFYTINFKKYKKVIILFIFIIIIFWGLNTTIRFIAPIKYEDVVDKYAKKYKLEKELVLSVINAESRFKKDAISKKGAIGLMQIMPDTGAWLAEKMGIKNFSKDMLYDVDKNINMGCYYLSMLIEKFEDEKLALCAYNAGSTNVYRWLKNEKYSLDGNIHTIPFQETDKYVKKINILKNIYKYSWR